MYKLLNIEKKEVNKLAPLFFFSFFSGFFTSIYFSVSNSEFVSVYGKDILPVGYLLSGIIGYTAVLGYTRIIKKAPAYISFMGGISFVIFVTILLLLFLAFFHGTALNILCFVVFLFAMPFISILGLVQTGILLSTFNIQESKKYTGIIGSGSTLAAILGCFSIPLFIPYINSAYSLLYIALAGLLLAAYCLIKINKRVEGESIKINATAAPGRMGLKDLLKQKYIRLIAICGGISMIAFYFVDFGFMLNLQAKYANSPKDLSAFIGGFFGLIKTGELLISLFSGRIFRLLGLKAGIVILPVTCLVLSLVLLSVHFISTSAAPVFLFFILMLKYLERVFRKAIEEPTFKALYQPLPAKDRLSIQVKIDGGTRQLFIIVASLLLIVSNAFMNNINTDLLFLVVPIYTLWFLSSLNLIKAFKEKLREILNSQNTSAAAVEKDMYAVISPSFKQTKGTDVLDYFFMPDNSSDKTYAQDSPDLKATKSGEGLNLFVPHQKLNYLKHDEGYSRIEFLIDSPLLIIPQCNETKFKGSIARFETFSDSDLLKIGMQEAVTDAAVKKKLGQTINLSAFIHEKKMALDILSKAGDETTFAILFEYLNFPDYFIRKQVYSAIEAGGYKYNDKEEALFQNAIDNTISAIGFMYSVLAVIPNAANYADLIRAVKEEELLLKDQLLSVLSWKYDSKSIQVLRDVLITKKTDSANNIIALELIDNLLDSYIKQKIAEVFNSSTYQSRVSALSKWVYLPRITFKEALVELLNHDYCLVGTWTKACAMTLMTNEFDPAYDRPLLACLFHHNSLLRSLAIAYSKKNELSFKAFLSERDKQGKTKNTEHDGALFYKNIKSLKRIPFFKEASNNELIDLAGSMVLNNTIGLQKIAGHDLRRDEPVLILEGKIIVEFKGPLPSPAILNGLITPNLIHPGGIAAVFVHEQTKLGILSRNEMNQLLFKSNHVSKAFIAYKAQ